MSKYIDADALIERINKKYVGNPALVSVDFTAKRIINSINKMPAADVEPVRKWFPCSKELPEEYGCYLVAWKPVGVSAGWISGNPHFYAILEFDPDDGWVDTIEQAPGCYVILAWQPLPNFYKIDGGSEE